MQAVLGDAVERGRPQRRVLVQLVARPVILGTRPRNFGRPPRDRMDLEPGLLQRRDRVPTDEAAASSEKDAPRHDKVGKAASRSERIGSGSGQSTPIAGSSQRIPRAIPSRYATVIW